MSESALTILIIAVVLMIVLHKVYGRPSRSNHGTGADGGGHPDRNHADDSGDFGGDGGGDGGGE